MTNFEKECDWCGYVKSHQWDSAYCIDCSTTNNDLIPRKEVEKMMQEKIYWLYRVINDEWEPQDEYLSEPQIALKELLQELSQIESVNGWIPIDKHPTERVIIRWIYEWEEFTATWKIDDDSYLDELWQRVAFAEYVTHYMPLPPPPIINKV